MDIKTMQTVMTPRLTKYMIHQPTITQTAFLLLPHLEVFFGGSAGGGKVALLDAGILTPHGFKACRDLVVGDMVNNPDGSIARIIALHPIQTEEGWTVHFHDSTSTTVMAGHLWKAWRSGVVKKRRGTKLFGEDGAEIVETRELARWVDAANAQQARGVRPSWPCIPLCAPQPFTVSMRYPSTLDPYLLGYLLGDGHIVSRSLDITSADRAHMEQVLTGIPYSFDAPYTYRLRGDAAATIADELTRLGLLGTHSDTKYVPREFLLGSIETRRAVLQGLLDTDGTVDARGQVYYTTVSPRLADAVCFLVQSLGGTATVFEKEPFYRAPDGKKVYGKRAYTLYIKHPQESSLFRMERKRARCVDGGNMYRRVVKVTRGEPVTGRCLTVSHPNGLYITDHFIVTHNSDVLLLAALQYVDIPGYSAIIFRNTYSNLALPGALIHRSKDWLKGTDARWVGADKLWTFPSGATLAFGYMEHEDHKYRYKSAEFQFCGFDELTQFTESMYTYMMSRMRRLEGAPIPIRVRGASNPGDIGHEWVRERFVQENIDAKKEGRVSERPFIASKLRDNPYLDQKEYAKALSNLDPIERRRLEDGDWDVLPEDTMFNRLSFKYIEPWNVPDNLKWFRFWDLATSQKQVADYTASAAVAMDSFGQMYIKDMVRDKKPWPEMRQVIVDTMLSEPGTIQSFESQQHGLAAVQEFHAMPELGRTTIYDVHTDKDKRERALPVAGKARRGEVNLVRGKWNVPFLDEICRFTGLNDAERSDQVDTVTGGHAAAVAWAQEQRKKQRGVLIQASAKSQWGGLQRIK